ncbi:MAG TPA: M14 family zinc carboxypeptidase, partial [Pseudonocardiaceae bacterium]|nr:M14 family zinc carboxypeptidase [Pseudonocardiaceae bacterium]
ADLRRLAEDNSEIAELHEIGRSVENRPIWALRPDVPHFSVTVWPPTCHVRRQVFAGWAVGWVVA